MKLFDYKQNNSDYTLFIKHKSGNVTSLIIYVDNKILTCDYLDEMKVLQEYLTTKFKMKDLCELTYFLKIKAARSKIEISLSWRNCVLDLLVETRMLDCKLVEKPIEMNYRLGEYLDQVFKDKRRYRILVGRLIYLLHTRSTITYVGSVISQFMHAPSEEHIIAVY